MEPTEGKGVSCSIKYVTRLENLRNARNVLCLATCLFDYNISGIKIGHSSATQNAVQAYHSRSSAKLSWKINLMLLFQLCDTFDLDRFLKLCEGMI